MVVYVSDLYLPKLLFEVHENLGGLTKVVI